MTRRDAHHRADVWGSLGQDTSPVVEIRALISGNGGVPSLVEIVEYNIRVRDYSVGIDMVNKVVTNWQVNPVLASNHSGTICRAFDNLQLIRGTDTACS